jgi:hypothetical protein
VVGKKEKKSLSVFPANKHYLFSSDVQEHDEKLNKQSLCEKEIENFAICGSNHYHKF